MASKTTVGGVPVLSYSDGVRDFLYVAQVDDKGKPLSPLACKMFFSVNALRKAAERGSIPGVTFSFRSYKQDKLPGPPPSAKATKPAKSPSLSTASTSSPYVEDRPIKMRPITRDTSRVPVALDNIPTMPPEPWLKMPWPEGIVVDEEIKDLAGWEADRLRVTPNTWFWAIAQTRAAFSIDSELTDISDIKPFFLEDAKKLNMPLADYLRLLIWWSFTEIDFDYLLEAYRKSERDINPKNDYAEIPTVKEEWMQ
jgi:hypothetical protein